jgi:hypothetical protein
MKEMIVRLINKDDIWIPTPKLFFDILKKTGLEFATNIDKDIVTEKLIEENEVEHSVWFFNIKIKFNVKSSKGSVPCDVQIIKSRKDDDISGCIVFSTESDLVVFKDFDYEFAKEDL